MQREKDRKDEGSDKGEHLIQRTEPGTAFTQRAVETTLIISARVIEPFRYGHLELPTRRTTYCTIAT